MISTGLPKTASPSYKHAEQGHSTDVVRDNTAIYSATVRDAGGTAGHDMGRGAALIVSWVLLAYLVGALLARIIVVWSF